MGILCNREHAVRTWHRQASFNIIVLRNEKDRMFFKDFSLPAVPLFFLPSLTFLPRLILVGSAISFMLRSENPIVLLIWVSVAVLHNYIKKYLLNSAVLP